jgi:hypothetical protein
MSQVTITNLASGTLSLDLTLDNGNIVIRESLVEGGSVDVGDRATIDDLNASSEVQALIAAGTISIAHLADAADIAEAVKLNSFAYLGAPVVADPNRLVDVLDPVADGALTIIAQPDVPRNITITITDANDSASGTVVLVGVDAAGRALTDTFVFGGGTKVFTGTKMYATLTSATVSGVAGAAAGDTIQVGVGDVIGLPSDIQVSTAVKYTSLGAVPVTPDAIAVGASTSGVDANGATYDGTKVMRVAYNTGE